MTIFVRVQIFYRKHLTRSFWRYRFLATLKRGKRIGWSRQKRSSLWKEGLWQGRCMHKTHRAKTQACIQLSPWDRSLRSFGLALIPTHQSEIPQWVKTRRLARRPSKWKLYFIFLLLLTSWRLGHYQRCSVCMHMSMYVWFKVGFQFCSSLLCRSIWMNDGSETHERRRSKNKTEKVSSNRIVISQSLKEALVNRERRGKREWKRNGMKRDFLFRSLYIPRVSW